MAKRNTLLQKSMGGALSQGKFQKKFGNGVNILELTISSGFSLDRSLLSVAIRREMKRDPIVNIRRRCWHVVSGVWQCCLGFCNPAAQWVAENSPWQICWLGTVHWDVLIVNCEVLSSDRHLLSTVRSSRICCFKSAFSRRNSATSFRRHLKIANRD